MNTSFDRSLKLQVCHFSTPPSTMCRVVHSFLNHLKLIVRFYHCFPLTCKVSFSAFWECKKSLLENRISFTYITTPRFRCYYPMDALGERRLGRAALWQSGVLGERQPPYSICVHRMRSGQRCETRGSFNPVVNVVNRKEKHILLA